MKFSFTAPRARQLAPARALTSRALWTLGAFVVASVLSAHLALAQTLGRATGDFTNLRPNKTESAFGRLAADAVRATGKADIALINAGALRPGTLENGPIDRADLAPLLSFGEDNIVTVVLTGAQLRAALERAASVYPIGSPAFLHVAGLSASFDPDAPVGSRVGAITVGGSALEAGKTYRAAMPVSLAQGAAGYFNIWNGAQSTPSGVQLIDAVGGYIRGQKEVSPDETARFGPTRG